MKRILVVDDDVDICMLLSSFLGKKGFEVSKAHSSKGMLNLMNEKKFDAVLCDFRLGDTDGLEAIAEIHKIDSSVPVIIITGYSDIKTAVNVIKSGAFDYVAKPLIPDEILHTINRALESSGNGAVQAVPALKKEKSLNDKLIGDYIIGESEVAKELFRQIDLVAPTNYSVIIYGESGSGKE